MPIAKPFRHLIPNCREILVRITSNRKFMLRITEPILNSFGDEAFAVASGIKHYEETIKNGGGGHLYRLRRNIHRLEKGLIMRPRREVFARDYIAETADSFRSLTQNPPANEPSLAIALKYAKDVLHEYFSTVGPGADSTVDEAREVFNSALASAGTQTGSNSRVPYQRATSPLACSFEALKELAHRRRSCRWFLPKPVPRDLIDRALEVGLQSPSACNRQPFRFFFIDDPDRATLVGDIPMGTKGFSHNFPCLALVVGQLRAFPHPRDRHVIYIDGALATMPFLFALETLGLSSCCINWPDIRALETKLRQNVDLADDERVVMLIAIGYPDPDGMVPFSEKKPVDEIRSYYQA